MNYLKQDQLTRRKEEDIVSQVFEYRIEGFSNIYVLNAMEKAAVSDEETLMTHIITDHCKLRLLVF